MGKMSYAVSFFFMTRKLVVFFVIVVVNYKASRFEAVKKGFLKSNRLNLKKKELEELKHRDE
jgi:hypothetical protein